MCKCDMYCWIGFCLNNKSISKPEYPHMWQWWALHIIVFVRMPNSLVVDINECKSADLNTCSEYADCTDNDGSYTCACKDGFLGDGF